MNLLAIVFLALSASILAVNIYGLFIKGKLYDVDTDNMAHPIFGRDTRCTKPVILKQRPSENKQRFIKRACQYINRHMLHYRQREGYDSVSFFDNWLLNILSFFPLNYFRTYEFHRVKRAFRKGHGFCSQLALMLYRICALNRIEVKILGLRGHVICHVKTESGYIVVDPDFNVVFDKNIAELHQDPNCIGNYYHDISEEKMNQLLSIFSKPYYFVNKGKNFFFKMALEDFFYIMKWFIPLGLFIFSACVLM